MYIDYEDGLIDVSHMIIDLQSRWSISSGRKMNGHVNSIIGFSVRIVWINDNLKQPIKNQLKRNQRWTRSWNS
jgi:hypothetical protein